MERELIHEDIIPAAQARAYAVKKGQILRIYLVEDHQVGDVVLYTAADHKEWFHVGQSWLTNVALGTGDGRSLKHFYSKPPRENLMMTTLTDTVKNHFANMGARCSRRSLERRGRGSEKRSCQESLEEALSPYGLTGDDIGDIFNVFLNPEMDENGKFSYKVSAAKAGDHIELLAEMDILAAVSACPAETIVNNYRAKPLGIKIFV